MIPPAFDYARPKTLPEAVALLGVGVALSVAGRLVALASASKAELDEFL